MQRSKLWFCRLLPYISLLALLCPPVLRAESSSVEYRENFERTVQLQPEGTISLGNIAGDIEVTTWGQPQVLIQAVKVSRAADMQTAQENAAAVEIEVQAAADAVDIQTLYPHAENNLNVSVFYTLTVPDHASLDIASVSGNIHAAGCGGTSDLHSVSGDVRAERVSGSIHTKSVSGNVLVDQATQDAECESVSGSVEARNIGGETFAKTVSGPITVAYSQGSVSAESVSGGLQVTEPANANFDLEASTCSGRLTSDFEVGGFQSESGREMQGTVNGGGKTVKLRSFSGRVEVKRR